MLRTARRAAATALLAALAACCLALACPAASARAEGGGASVELYEGAPSANERFSVAGMLPGDAESRDFVVKVAHAEPLDVRFAVEVVSDERGLADVLNVRLEDAAGTVVYDGPASALSREPATLRVDDGAGETVLACRVTVSLSASAGNEFQGAHAQIDLHWSVDASDEGKLAPLAKTGDALGAALGALVLLCVAAAAALAARRLQGRRRQALRLVAAVALASLVVALAWALLSPRASVRGNVFDTGTVSIDLNGGAPAFSERSARLEPGRAVTEELVVANTGTAAARYCLYLENLQGDAADAVEFTVLLGDAVLFSGNASQLEHCGSCASPTILEPGQAETLAVSVRLQEGAGDDLQGGGVGFDLCADAVQVANVGGGGF
ncbi:hypothetical protein [Eggerthella timonensis]|uniref:hypothetical protein n=1 Tax=Eggerthella timonensis TaxID=1871008 RepID=UPI000C77A23F|nr:hypothetical protein [Eggerthella timonensis]